MGWVLDVVVDDVAVVVVAADVIVVSGLQDLKVAREADILQAEKFLARVRIPDGC